MELAGIVAEFNPFHAGHKYLIERARGNGATHIAICMSGSAVQRGELAITDKHVRAAAAINGGADLVAELPSPYSCSMASCFADSAVRILVQLGIDALAFGSEYDDTAKLNAACDALAGLQDSSEVSRLTSQGMSYPSALRKAAEKRFGADTADIISSPNSTLAVEYIAALRKASSRAELLPIKRVGAAHDSGSGGKYPSGMELRSRMMSGELRTEFAPVDPTAAEQVIYYNILTADKSALTALPELGEPLADRMLKLAADPPPTLGEFLMQVKNKSCTLARLRRSALHLTLGVNAADVAAEPPYIRILAMNERGREVLSRAKPAVPISTSLKKLEQSSERAARVIAIENRAVRLMQLCTGSFENEFRRKISLQK